jgi:hypothetical protein
MKRQTRLAATLALVAALGVAGAAAAQTQGGTATTPAASDKSALPSAQPAHPAPNHPIKPGPPDTNQPVYSVPAPPDSSPGLYLPAVVGGYAKSAAGCVVAGCDDGPSVTPPASTSGSDQPPPTTSGSSTAPVPPAPH